MSEKYPIIGSMPVMSQPITPVGMAQFGSVQGNMVCLLEGHRDWSSGIFECTNDLNNCVMVAFCTPCMQCQLATRLGECACMPFCVPASTVAMRTKLRTVGGIQGTICMDYVMTLFCGHCVLCQMKREMDELRIL